MKNFQRVNFLNVFSDFFTSSKWKWNFWLWLTLKAVKAFTIFQIWWFWVFVTWFVIWAENESVEVSNDKFSQRTGTNPKHICGQLKSSLLKMWQSWRFLSFDEFCKHFQRLLSLDGKFQSLSELKLHVIGLSTLLNVQTPKFNVIRITCCNNLLPICKLLFSNEAIYAIKIGLNSTFTAISCNSFCSASFELKLRFYHIFQS